MKTAKNENMKRRAKSVFVYIIVIAMALGVVVAIGFIVGFNQAVVSGYPAQYPPDSMERKIAGTGIPLNNMTGLAYMEKGDKVFAVIHRDGENSVDGIGQAFIKEEKGRLRKPKDIFGMPWSDNKYMSGATIFKDNGVYIFAFDLAHDMTSGEIPFEVKDLELYDQDGNKLDKVMVEGENDGAFFYVTDEIGDDFKIVAKYGDDEDIVFVKEDFAVYEQLRGN